MLYNNAIQLNNSVGYSYWKPTAQGPNIQQLEKKIKKCTFKV